MDDLTKFKTECTSCGHKTAKNVSPTRTNKVTIQVGSVKYHSIQHKVVRCTKCGQCYTARRFKDAETIMQVPDETLSFGGN